MADTPDNSNSAYQAAITNVNEVTQLMIDRSADWLDRTQATIDALGNWKPPDEATAPDIRPQPITANPLPSFPPPDPTLFGDVGDFTAPDYQDLRDLIDGIDVTDPGPFSPKTGIQSLPTAPRVDYSGRPTAPVLTMPDMPVAPDSQQPELDALDPINTPATPQITVPDFDVGEIPTLDTTPPPLQLQWSESPYNPLVVDQLTTTIRAMLAGDFAMQPVVQAALFAAARDREALTARAAVENAFEDWAARNFSMPPGMLVEQVDTAREQSQLREATLSRDVFTKAAEWQIENLRAAVAQGIALETMWGQLWNWTAQRVFDAAKTVVEITKDIFNLRIAAFNAAITRVQAIREVFEAKLRAELAKLDILKAEIEAEQLKGTLNEQKVRIYTARLGALETLARLFSAKLEGVKVQADIQRLEVDKFKSENEAWAETQKLAFEAYDSSTRGIAVSGQLYESESRAYAATVQAASEKNNAKARVAEAKLKAIETGTQKFLGLVQGLTAQINAKRDSIQARAQSYTADTGRWGEQLRYATQGEDLRIRAFESTMRNTIAYFQTISTQFESRMQRLVTVSGMIKDALTSAGGMTAQMAAGAMSAIHAQSSVSGSGQSSTSQSHDTRVNYDVSTDSPPNI